MQTLTRKQFEEAATKWLRTFNCTDRWLFWLDIEIAEEPHATFAVAEMTDLFTKEWEYTFFGPPTDASLMLEEVDENA